MYTVDRKDGEEMTRLAVCETIEQASRIIDNDAQIRGIAGYVYVIEHVKEEIGRAHV